MKPALLIYANCQGVEFARVLTRTPSVSSRFEIKFIEYNMLVEPGYGWDSYPPGWFDNVEVVWEQLGSDYATERAHFHTLRPNGARVVRFPALTLLALWPFTGGDPRQVPEPPLYSTGRYRWTDAVAAHVAGVVAGVGLTDDEVFDRYMEVAAARMPNLERRLAQDVQRWRERDGGADVPVADLLLGSLRRIKLFNAWGRVTAEPLRMLLPRLLAATLGEAESAQAAGEVSQLLVHHLGQHWEQAPIHPAVAERLGLGWHDPEARYRFHSHTFSYRQFVVRMVRNAPYVR